MLEGPKRWQVVKPLAGNLDRRSTGSSALKPAIAKTILDSGVGVKWA
jgi:hypothetical protein